MSGQPGTGACWAGRRVLVVLDDARELPDQVEPLLPGSPSCVAVVTSRDALAGLVARDGAHRLDLGLLSTSLAMSSYSGARR